MKGLLVSILALTALVGCKSLDYAVGRAGSTQKVYLGSVPRQVPLRHLERYACADGRAVACERVGRLREVGECYCPLGL
jgi:hypothetical protein